ncbi:MAG: hypothetical protein P4L03_10360 [Terracidiphilus sp.]|nr:hypothetical protein [Terracidiphilus sp.]
MNCTAKTCAYWVVTALPAMLALVYSSAFYAAFSAPKNAVLVGAAAVLAALVLACCGPWQPARDEWVFWGATVGMAVVAALSAALAQYPWMCAGGVAQAVSGPVLAFAAVRLLEGEGRQRAWWNIWRNVLRVTAVAGVGLALVTVAQYFLGSAPGRMRMYGTVGNPDFVAALLAAMTPVAIVLWMQPVECVASSHPFRKERGKDGAPCKETVSSQVPKCEGPGAPSSQYSWGGSIWAGSIWRSAAKWRGAWLGAAFLLVVAIVLTGSRGGLLALVAGLAVLALLAVEGWRSRLALIGVLLALCALAWGTGLNARTPWESLRGRVLIWQVALGDGAARSALGSGPGSIAYAYPASLGHYFATPGRNAQLRFASLERHAQNDFVEAWHDMG